MTTALCLSCGSTKFGAILRCRHCGAGSCGDPQTDIFFSDHRLTVACLEALGSVIRAIAQVASDPEERFYSFMQYVASREQSRITLNLSPELAARCQAVLERASPPAVEVERVPRP